jgi:hypothetical protein
VTPALAWCLVHEVTPPPLEVRHYFEEILALNAKRNETLLTELARVVRTLSAIDVEPVLLKGAARLIKGTYPATMLRFLGDLDVLIPASRSAAAVASPLLARGEGGIVHHRNVFPHDGHLRLWTGLVSAVAGARAPAAAEFPAAAALGLGDRVL